MDTRHLEEFVAFARCLNYVRAAKEMYVSPTTLAAHVGELEKELGTPLVQKRLSKLMLTPAGKRLVTEAARFIEEARQMGETLRAEARDVVQLFVVSNGMSLFEARLIGACARFREQTPGGRVDLVTSSAFMQGWQALDSFDSDIAPYSALRLGSGPACLDDAGDCELTYLYTEDVFFFVPERDPLYGRDELALRDLDGRTVLYADVESWRASSLVLRRLLRDEGADVTPHYVDADNYLQFMLYYDEDALRTVSRNAIKGLVDTGALGGKLLPCEGGALKWDVFAASRPDAPDVVKRFKEFL